MARSLRTHHTAFTLIEVMLVVVIMAIMAAGASYGLGAVARAELRSASLKVLAAARFAHHRALIQGTTVRIVFDLDKGTMALEEADSMTALNRKQSKSEDDKVLNDQGSVDPWEAAKSRMTSVFKPKKAKSPFHTLSSDDGVPVQRAKAQPLGRGITVAKLFSPHSPKPETRGKAALYFFPGGRGEHAMVQLKNDRGVIYSVELWPLTARGRVIAHAEEPKELTESDLGLETKEVIRGG